MLVTKYRPRFQDDKRRQSYEGSPHHDTEMILLRGPEKPDAKNWFDDCPQVNQPILTEWKSARALLGRIKTSLSPLPIMGGKPIELGKVMIVSLKAGGFVDWHIDEGEYAETHLRGHLCLIPSPGAWLLSGGEAAMPAVGVLTYFNNRVLHSAINLGDYPRVHLIVDVRRPDAL